jgi:membrane-bound lytic murein transglycosylase B
MFQVGGRVSVIVLIGASAMLMSPPAHVAHVYAAAAAPLRSQAPTPPAGQASPPPTDPAREDFQAWLAGVRSEALALGLKEETVSAALDDIEPLPIVLERDRAQAELVLSLDEYLKRRLTRRFIRTGREQAVAQAKLLKEVTAQYGVQRKYIVALWGIESNYGRFQGVRPVIPALATLAWEGRRGAFFKGELFNALEILDRGYIGLSQLRGSWAGAMGQTQFMPSSYLKYAQDFDGDGHRDIWGSEGDIFASIANYLKAHGWTADQTWGREVRLPKGGALSVVDKIGMRTTGCRAHREMTNAAPLSRWQALGVRALNGGALPRVDRDASLFHSGHRSFLLYGNYEALLGYNCAHTYALSVALLADQID